MRTLRLGKCLQLSGLAAMTLLISGCDETEAILDTIWLALDIVEIWL